MIQDQYNLNDEYFVQEFHLILVQILDAFIKKIKLNISNKNFPLTSNFLN